MAHKKKSSKKKTSTKSRTTHKPKKKPAKVKMTGTLDAVISDGLNTGTRKQRAASATKASEHPMHARTHKAVIAIFRECYPGDDTEQEILGTDPNDYDMDPSMFYEVLEERMGVSHDPNNEYFGGYGGPIRDLIAFLTLRWDGKLH